MADNDIVFLHIKGPDICAHDGDYETKKKLLEAVDAKLEPLLGRDLAIAVTGDHSTDCNTGNHTGDPVPSLLFSPQGATRSLQQFRRSRLCRRRAGAITCHRPVVLDAMGVMRKFRPGDEAYYAP